jgi:glycosyltransferase involved in cell wall biosynthesis
MAIDSARSSKTEGVAILGLFRDTLGLGTSARRMAQSLKSAGYPLTLHDVRLPDREADFDIEGLADGPPAYRDLIIHLNPPELLKLGTRYLQFDPTRHYLIGYWAWELPVFPAIWAPGLNCVHEIWTPSQFGADHYKDLVRKPVRVIPHAVPINDIFRNDARKQLGLPTDRFIFLMAFDTDSFPMRKNPDGVVRAFTDAFPSRTDSSPILVIKMHGHRNRNQALRELLQKARDDSSIFVIDEVFTETQIRHLQAACDCYVSLHRSECFGLNIAECMAAGKLTIVTNFSGNTDFTTAQNSILIPYAMRVVQPDEYHDGRGQWWAEPNHEAAVEAMRWAVANPGPAEQLAHKAKADMTSNHSFDRIGKITVRALNSRFTDISIRIDHQNYNSTEGQLYWRALEAYRNSTSWKITAPLRFVGRGVYSLAEAGRLFFDWLRRANDRRK